MKSLLALFNTKVMKIHAAYCYILILFLISCYQKDEEVCLHQSFEVSIYGNFDKVSLKTIFSEAHPYCIISVIQNDLEIGRHSFYLEFPDETTAVGFMQGTKLPLYELTLPIGDYHLLAWIDYRITEDTSYYMTENLRAIRMKDGVADVRKEAYAACLPLTLSSDNLVTQAFSLVFYSPLSSYTLTTDLGEINTDESMNSILTYKGYVPVTYDILTECCVASLLNPSVRYSDIQKKGENFVVASDYIFTDKNKVTPIDMEVTIGDSSGGIIYHVSSVSLSLKSAGHVAKYVEMKDLGEGNIIDGEISGEIDIVIN
ncbi:DUF6562 domain-containing protein [Bacteroides oleiciplenus]|uniref:DUF6562 domain-containing protein n=1 Tax=Bacteroides oleiciplenus YIT 12058 TaxID=742727 RepID=K9EUC1_9BACE|nr:DUF6562 domain-containing protein [Bacteroides oleiciplenus]EKU92775.1 hypothetical protein HMPREF9447_00432 [Bacteroides oleiciplenus YIT 12058]